MWEHPALTAPRQAIAHYPEQHSLGLYKALHSALFHPIYIYCQLPYSRPSVAPCSSVLTGQQQHKVRAVCTGNILPLFQNHCHGSSSSCCCWSELIKKHSLLLYIMSVATFSDIFTRNRNRILNSTQVHLSSESASSDRLCRVNRFAIIVEKTYFLP